MCGYPLGTIIVSFVGKPFQALISIGKIGDSNLWLAGCCHPFYSFCKLTITFYIRAAVAIDCNMGPSRTGMDKLSFFIFFSFHRNLLLHQITILTLIEIEAWEKPRPMTNNSCNNSHYIGLISGTMDTGPKILSSRT